MQRRWSVKRVAQALWLSIILLQHAERMCPCLFSGHLSISVRNASLAGHQRRARQHHGDEWDSISSPPDSIWCSLLCANSICAEIWAAAMQRAEGLHSWGIAEVSIRRQAGWSQTVIFVSCKMIHCELVFSQLVFASLVQTKVPLGEALRHPWAPRGRVKPTVIPRLFLSCHYEIDIFSF